MADHLCLENSLSGVPAPQLTLGLCTTKQPQYADGDAVCLSFDSRGRLLVANPEQDQVNLEITAIEAGTTQAKIKFASKNYRRREEKEEAIEIEQALTRRAIDSKKFEFYSTLVRWAIGAATLISSCYLLA